MSAQKTLRGDPSMTANDDEKRAKEWLKDMGFAVEPGADPPDLVVDQRCAVEVTRLQTIEDRETLTEREGLRKTLDRVLSEFGPAGDGGGYMVDCEVRLVPAAKSVKKEVRSALCGWLDSREHSLRGPPRGNFAILAEDADIALACGIRLRVTGPFGSLQRRFHLANVDSGMGCFLVPEYLAAIPGRVEEKTRKVRGRLDRYTEWWLVFLDHLGYVPLATPELRDVGRSLTCGAPWSRILVVSVTRPHRHCELWRTDGLAPIGPPRR